MSLYTIGETVTVKNVNTGAETNVVITQIRVVDGYNCYRVRRADNKQFKLKDNKVSFNKWVQGEKVEEGSHEKT